jgi:putative flippase GtrA
MTGSQLRQLARFVLVGGLSTLLYSAVTLYLQKIAGVGPALSSGAGFAVSIACSYLGHALYTFQQQGVAIGSGLKFAIATFVIAGGLSLLNGYLVDTQGWSVVAAALVNSGLYPAMSFLVHSVWSFSGRDHRGHVGCRRVRGVPFSQCSDGSGRFD